LPVCQAVQHAHQKGVIHRDLKPSNVMVTMRDDVPMPKVIDFGIAKAMHSRLTEKTLFTRYEQFIGTPTYMSPEQAEMSALDIDTRTDIYSLGVLLYEVLTGTTPFDDTTLRKAGLVEILRIIREEQPPRPSLRISTAGEAVPQRRSPDAAGLSRLLRGDLDWIVMKALEKDRARRYATAGELADDIRRHLHSEPVMAGPPGTAYRFRKFLARNRAGVLTVGLLAMALVAGIIGTTAGLVQSRRNAILANQQRERAVAAVDFLLATLSLTNPEVALNPEVSVRTLLDHTAARVAEEFADYPAAEVRVRSTIGRAYARLGLNAQAEPHLRRVREMVQQIAPEDKQAWQALRAAGFDDFEYYNALWALTNVSFNLQRNDSFAVAAEARTVGTTHLAKTQPQLAELLETFVITVHKNAWSHEPDVMSQVPQLFARAVTEAEKALLEGDPRWPIVADTFLVGGYTVWYTPHEPLAESFWRKALEIQQRELPANHPDIGTTVNLLVGILNQSGKMDESEALIRDSLENLQSTYQEGAFPIARAEGALGQTLTKQGRFDEAEPILLRSHQNIMANVKSAANYMALESFHRLVDLYQSWQRPEQAEPYAQAIAEAAATGQYVQQWLVLRAAFGPAHQTLIDAADRFAELSGGLSYSLAPGLTYVPQIGPVVKDLITARDELLEPRSARSAAFSRLMLAWANALEPVKHRQQRELLAKAALEVLQQWSEEVPLDAAEAASILAECANAREAADETHQYAMLASKQLMDGQAEGDWFQAAQRIRIVRSLLTAGMHVQAEPVLLSGFHVLSAQLGKRHPDTVTARKMLHELYTTLRRPEDASRYEPLPPHSL
jgi:hypothetical protein